jgi:hypothetical protein
MKGDYSFGMDGEKLSEERKRERVLVSYHGHWCFFQRERESRRERERER